ncbi:MAG: sec-independent protein translocase protein TatC [Pseudonocardiales bacterium]|jgi:sec-independent protein translocase protein TatC|nr:sec-independent protein translocase protein TatC [Pseudonocardiales bacterium]
MLSLRKRATKDPEGRMSVLDHLRELRRRLIVVIIIIAAGAVIGWILYNPILEILKHPYCTIPYKHRLGAQSQGECNLFFRGPLDGFTIRLKVSFIAGAILTAPFWLFQLWAFVTPGLRKNERRWTVAFVATSSVLFFAGMALAYVTLAKGLQVLVVSAGEGTQAALDVTSYISFVTLMLLIFGASFELPLLIVMLNLVRVLPFSILKRGQRLGVFLVFVFAAVATPSTDPFTMVAMAIPMCILFEAAVLFAFLNDRRRARRQIAEEAEQLPDDVASQIDPFPEQLPAHTSGPGGSEWNELP